MTTSIHRYQVMMNFLLVLLLTLSMNIFALVVFSVSTSKEEFLVIGYNSDNISLETIIMLTIPPFIEEIAFRLGIVYNYKLNAFLLAAVVFITALSFFEITKTLLLILLIISILVFIISFIFLKFLYSRIGLRKNVIVFFFSTLSILLFTFSHINNFKLYDGYVFYILIFRVFINGCVYTFIRLKYGIIYSLFAHYFYNLMDFIFAYFSIYYLFKTLF